MRLPKRMREKKNLSLTFTNFMALNTFTALNFILITCQSTDDKVFISVPRRFSGEENIIPITVQQEDRNQTSQMLPWHRKSVTQFRNVAKLLCMA